MNLRPEIKDRHLKSIGYKIDLVEAALAQQEIDIRSIAKLTELEAINHGGLQLYLSFQHTWLLLQKSILDQDPKQQGNFRRYLGDYTPILNDAKNGKFSRLKTFCYENSIWEAELAGLCESKHLAEAQLNLSAGYLSISHRIPVIGTPYKPPRPVWL